MRRLLVLALFAAPAPASAQFIPAPNPGAIAFPDDLHSPNDSFINADECANHGAVTMRWDAAGAASTTGSPVTITDYTVYASNVASGQSETATGPCPTQNDNNGLFARAVSETLAATSTNPNGVNASNPQTFDASLIATAAGKSCNSLADEPIVICVQASNRGTNVSTARGKVILSTRKPNKPENVNPESGNNAINVSWSKPTNDSPVAQYYRIEASVVGVTTTAVSDPAGIHTSGPVTTTSGYRFTGDGAGHLVNGVIYSVRMFSYSEADNRSDPADAGTVVPELANDFWTAYRDAGGQEVGGCSSGVAGPIGLLALAATLLLARRRS